MTIKCSVFCGASLDGFIAGPRGEIDWLDRPEYASSAMPGLSYEEFIPTVDTLVMGRNTFGLTIQSFLKERLINEITVTILPVLIGAGISLFGTTDSESLLTLLDVTSASNGFVQVRYRVVHAL